MVHLKRSLSIAGVRVIDIGAKVILTGGKEATVIAVQIERGMISYRVAFWNGECRNTEWLTDTEIEQSEEKFLILNELQEEESQEAGQ